MKTFLLCFAVCGVFQLTSANANLDSKQLSLEEHVNVLSQELSELKAKVMSQNDNKSKRMSDKGLSNSTLEERVSVLELEMTEVTDDVTDLEQGLTLVESEQIIQDTRILKIETDTSSLESAVDGFGDQLANVEASVSSLDIRLDRLEVSGAIAFTAHINDVDIPIGSTVAYGSVALNVGDGYNNVNGEFTVPPGGAGLYYFHVNMWLEGNERSVFSITVNGEALCYAEYDGSVTGDPEDDQLATCSATVLLAEGDTAYVVYVFGLDSSPFGADGLLNVFTGFRLAPE